MCEEYTMGLRIKVNESTVELKVSSDACHALIASESAQQIAKRYGDETAKAHAATVVTASRPLLSAAAVDALAIAATPGLEWTQKSAHMKGALRFYRAIR